MLGRACMKWNKFPETKPDEYESVWIWVDNTPYVGFLYDLRMHSPDKSFEKCLWQEIVPPTKEEKE